jgi:hypothetical protein
MNKNLKRKNIIFQKSNNMGKCLNVKKVRHKIIPKNAFIFHREILQNNSDKNSNSGQNKNKTMAPFFIGKNFI